MEGSLGGKVGRDGCRWAGRPNVKKAEKKGAVFRPGVIRRKKQPTKEPHKKNERTVGKRQFRNPPGGHVHGGKRWVIRRGIGPQGQKSKVVSAKRKQTKQKRKKNR